MRQKFYDAKFEFGQVNQQARTVLGVAKSLKAKSACKEIITSDVMGRFNLWSVRELIPNAERTKDQKI